MPSSTTQTRPDTACPRCAEEKEANDRMDAIDARMEILISKLEWLSEKVRAAQERKAAQAGKA